MSTELRISAADGYALGAAQFGDATSGPVVIVNGATAVRQRYYARFAEWLSEHGVTTLTYDYRGIGASRPARLRGFRARMRDWGLLDFEGVLRFAASAFPGRPLISVGHSVGGQMLGFPPSNTSLSGAITVAAQSGYWRHWSGLGRARMWVNWHALLPAVSGAVGYVPGKLGMGEDLPAGVAQEWARWGTLPGFFTDDGISRDGFTRLRAPVLGFSFADDDYAPRPAVDWLHDLMSGSRVSRRHIDTRRDGAVGHFGFFRERVGGRFWPEVLDFVRSAASPRSHLA